MAARGNTKSLIDEEIKKAIENILDNNGEGLTYDEWILKVHKDMIFDNLSILNEGLEIRKELGN
ncbi:TPA: hypothetical protein I9071_002629 [Clostridium perfringens]|nr:hypothetical protein [Clostridium perfringens]HAT4321469.1 hypothetical protein [Clostridium perfringens]